MHLYLILLDTNMCLISDRVIKIGDKITKAMDGNLINGMEIKEMIGVLMGGVTIMEEVESMRIKEEIVGVEIMEEAGMIIKEA